MTRSEILDSPFSKPALKPEVRRRLDDIAAQTNAHIAVVNSPMSLSNRTPPDGISSSAGWSGLETERVCELVITGSEDSVCLARVRLLVMLDELVCIPFSVPDSPFLSFFPERAPFRNMRDRPEASCHYCWPKTIHAPDYTGRDWHQHLSSFASARFGWARPRCIWRSESREHQKYDLDYRRIFRCAESARHALSGVIDQSSSPFTAIWSDEPNDFQ